MGPPRLSELALEGWRVVPKSESSGIRDQVFEQYELENPRTYKWSRDGVNVYVFVGMGPVFVTVAFWLEGTDLCHAPLDETWPEVCRWHSGLLKHLNYTQMLWPKGW